MQMMRTGLLLLVILIALLPVGALAQKVSKETIISEGKKRSYYIYLPEKAKGPAPAPLLVLLHGSNHNGLSLVEKWTDLAKAEGIILLGPDSADPAYWSVPGDGPAFLHELVESIKARYPVDEKRVYLFGHSGGAIFALLMSLYESEYFASTAIHAGSLDSDANALIDLARRKIPIQIQVGTEDPFFPLASVRATRDVLNSRGFSVQLTEIPRHDHWYYDLAPKINLTAWQFLKTQELSTAPRFEEHHFKPAGKTSSEVVEQYNRGMARQQAGDVTAAIAAYTRAIELDPKYADAYNNRGVAYMGQKDYAAAVADFTHSIELEPSDAAYNNRGNIYISLKKLDEAIADFTQAIKLKPSVETYTNRGIAYQQINQDELAISDYERAIQLNANFARPHILRGLILLKRDQDAAAWKDLDKGFQLDPGLHAEFDPIVKQLRPNQ